VEGAGYFELLITEECEGFPLLRSGGCSGIFHVIFLDRNVIRFL